MKYDLIIIENLALEEIRTPKGTKTVRGSSAYFALFPALFYSKKIGIVSVIGNDFDLKELKNMGLDMKGIKIIKKGKSLQICDSYSNDYSSRTVTYKSGVSSNLSVKLFPNIYLNTKTIFLPTSPPLKQLEFAKFLKRKIKNKTSLAVDTIEHYIKSYPKAVATIFSLADIIFLNEEEYKLANDMNLLNGNRNKALIIKSGKNGASYNSIRYKYHCRAPKVEVIDPTGAGDCLAGVFLTLRARGWSIKNALKKAVKIASLSVKDFGIEHIRDSSYLKNITKKQNRKIYKTL